MTCYESFGTHISGGDWVWRCADEPCKDQTFDQSVQGDSALPCTSQNLFRQVLDYEGTCDSVASEPPADDSGQRKVDGAICSSDAECRSRNCVSVDGETFVCASPCTGSACSDDGVCFEGYCLPACMGL